MQILDGKKIARQIRGEVRAEAAKAATKPCMAVVQVGGDPASTVYINMKEKACADVGIDFVRVALPEDITAQQMLDEIDRLNADENIHGFIVQKPLPAHLPDAQIVERIAPAKDIDCLHPHNVGLIAANRGKLLPCTPAGVIALLDAYNIPIAGKHCVIIGRSPIVGKPLGLMLLNRDATVTTLHSRSFNLKEHTRRADILVAAIGRTNFVTVDMLKEGAVVIDVGINRLSAGEAKLLGLAPDKTLCGDVDFKNCAEKASYITPVPGGVGPMTVAILMQNALKGAIQ